jgi:hypothetical protein
LIPNPIHKVLSSMREHRVRSLLMGGQACVFYGAAEFSRGVDFAILADAANLGRLRKALRELLAGPIAVPDFSLKHLRKSHAVHFRCQHPDAFRLRVDVMSKMRGIAPFAALWRRRTVIEMPDGTECALMSLPDLVVAKKTQRDKDWPMIRRLVEAHYFQNHTDSTAARIRFWLTELRTPELLIELAAKAPAAARRLVSARPLLEHTISGNVDTLLTALASEESAERKRDREYWLPLKKELEALRHGRE